MTDITNHVQDAPEHTTAPKRALEIVRTNPDISSAQLGDMLRVEGYSVSKAYQNVLKSSSKAKLNGGSQKVSTSKRSRRRKDRLGKLVDGAPVQKPDLVRTVALLRKHYTHQEVVEALDTLSGIR
jgi:hypothetical protein